MAQYKVLYDFTAEEEGEMSVKTGEIVVAVEDVPGAEDPPDGWIHVEVLGDSERGFVPIDYLDPLPKSFEKSDSKPFGGLNVLPSEPPAAPPSAPSKPKSPVGIKGKSVFPIVNKAESLANPSPNAAAALQAFSANVKRSSSPPSRGTLSPPLPQPSYTQSYQPPAAPITPVHTPITAAMQSTTAAQSNGPSALGKLKSAAKSVQSMVHVSSAVSAPRVPSLSAAVDREDFDELVKRNDEYFARLLSSQADTFSSLTDMVDALSKKLKESTQSSSDLVSKLSELDELIDEEKRKWKQQHENEKNEDVLGRSKELSQAAYESYA